MESNGIEEQGRIAFVQSCWHRDIVDECRDSFLAEVQARGVAADRVDLFEVTGAFEIPAAQADTYGHADGMKLISGANPSIMSEGQYRLGKRKESTCRAIPKRTAAAGLTRPEGIGRLAVRAMRASMSRSQ